jgi:hypothetical protein
MQGIAEFIGVSGHIFGKNMTWENGDWERTGGGQFPLIFFVFLCF